MAGMAGEERFNERLESKVEEDGARVRTAAGADLRNLQLACLADNLVSREVDGACVPGVRMNAPDTRRKNLPPPASHIIKFCEGRR